MFNVIPRVCVSAACCSGQVVKAVEAQTNKQEDKKDVPGETGYTQKHTRTHMYRTTNEIPQFFSFLMASCLVCLTN